MVPKKTTVPTRINTKVVLMPAVTYPKRPLLRGFRLLIVRRYAGFTPLLAEKRVE